MWVYVLYGLVCIVFVLMSFNVFFMNSYVKLSLLLCKFINS